jgi:3-hydroxyisobutyrate dehydrogenase-like beta-hydroxyacid dehydrogenase
MVYLTSINKALIGFIGLGNMGAHMAKNLIKKGHELVIFDLNKQVVNDLTKLGIHFFIRSSINTSFKKIL